MAIVKTVFQGTRKLIINVTGLFNTADETDVVIIDRSTLIGPDQKTIPGKIRIDEVTWSVGAGYDYVVLDWDDATDEVIDYFQGQGYMDYRPFGGKSMSGTPINDTEGDIQLSTSGGAAGDTYSFLIECSLKN